MNTQSKSNVKADGASMAADLLQIVKGCLIALILTIFSFLIFALIIKVCNLDISLIPKVNLFIKIASIVISVVCITRRSREKGWIKGACIGLLYILFAFLIFSAVSRNYGIVGSLSFMDVIFGMVFGSISGIIGVNIK